MAVFPIIACKAPSPRNSQVKPPEIRVSILEHKPTVDFRISDTASIVTRESNVATRDLSAGLWRVEVLNATAAKFKYRLAVRTTKDRIAAEDVAISLANKGLEARVEKYDREAKLSLRYASSAVYQVVLSKDFKTMDEAKTFQDAIKEKTGSEIIEVPVGKATGALRFTHLDSNNSFESQDRLTLKVENLVILNVEIGSGFHWQSTENRAYNGSIEFLLDDYGLVTLVNALSLEDYLKGVVPSEMPENFPYEALKAQAIAARVEAMAKLGLRHPGQPFDLCDDVHCQVFSGSTRAGEATSNAVASTRGIFMIYRKKMVDAFYHAVCGGHTENIENVWNMDPRPYLNGRVDRGGRSLQRLTSSLAEEKNLRKWIDSRPDVFCNTTRADVPPALEYSKKYFRWRIEYDRTELETILRERTGEDFGFLLELNPIKRGVSGRLLELEVVGSKKRFTITREFAIRQALSKTTLFSACCYFEKVGGPRELPQKFIIKGAGWGHGVGMCQVGAALMARNGKKFDEILTHYYPGIVLEILYN
jgi:SpoIID/LytB domain protein